MDIVKERRVNNYVNQQKPRSCPILWISNKVRRVARSTLTEIFALTDRTNSAFFVNQLAQKASLIRPLSNLQTTNLCMTAWAQLQERHNKEQIKLH